MVIPSDTVIGIYLGYKSPIEFIHYFNKFLNCNEGDWSVVPSVENKENDPFHFPGTAYQASEYTVLGKKVVLLAAEENQYEREIFQDYFHQKPVNNRFRYTYSKISRFSEDLHNPNLSDLVILSYPDRIEWIKKYLETKVRTELASQNETFYEIPPQTGSFSTTLFQVHNLRIRMIWKSGNEDCNVSPPEPKDVDFAFGRGKSLIAYCTNFLKKV